MGVHDAAELIQSWWRAKHLRLDTSQDQMQRSLDKGEEQNLPRPSDTSQRQSTVQLLSDTVEEQNLLQPSSAGQRFRLVDSSSMDANGLTLLPLEGSTERISKHS